MGITESMIKKGLDDGIVTITFDEGMYDGVACKVGTGKTWTQFWFAGSAGDNAESLDDFYKNYCDKDELPTLLYECIGTLQKAEENGISVDKWQFCFGVLDDYCNQKTEVKKEG